MSSFSSAFDGWCEDGLNQELLAWHLPVVSFHPFDSLRPRSHHHKVTIQALLGRVACRIQQPLAWRGVMIRAQANRQGFTFPVW